MIKIKLELKKMTDIEAVEESKLVGGKLTGNSNFTSPTVPGATLVSNGTALETLLLQRDALDLQVQQVTIQIRSARDKLETDLNLDAAHVEQQINLVTGAATVVDPLVAAAKARSAGMEVVDAATPVGPMPKVEGLKATQGDADCEVDLQWNPVKRGLKNYHVEMTTDPNGLTGWHHVGSPTKSSMTVKGLTSGQRYFFRVCANGAAGMGPPSGSATKVAP
jgi:hypothetical protein